MQVNKIKTPILETHSNFDSLAAEEQLIILFDNYSIKDEQLIISYEEIFKDIDAIKRTAIIITEMLDYYKENSTVFSDADSQSIMLTIGMLDERIQASYTALYEITEHYLDNPIVEEVLQISFNFKADELAKEFEAGRYKMYITNADLNQLNANEGTIVEIIKTKSLEMAKWRKELMLLNK